MDVYIVDDDPAALLSVREALAETGYMVRESLSSVVALRQAPLLRPRLLILDVSMPDLDGVSLCRQLHDVQATRGTPVLFLSSNAALESRLAGIRAGAVDFLCKPFVPEEMAARVRSHLELAAVREEAESLNLELRDANRQLHAGFGSASRVQRALLPEPRLSDGQISFAWQCRQVDQIGGDSVGIVRVDSRTHAFYILDACGHGVSASLLAVASGYLVSALSGNLLRHSTPTTFMSPACVLNDLNRVLRAMAPMGVFVTIVVGRVDAASGKVTLASAGHPGPLAVRGSGAAAFFDSSSPPIGIQDWEYEERSMILDPGDRLVLYTDGAYEQRNRFGEHFGRNRLRETLKTTVSLSPDHALADLLQQLERWQEGRPSDDDLSVLIVHRDATNE